ncbi:hypothetical protein EYF80_056966 [Liparis tanakae]|uniref:Uncharacterized protein n=1 Tax=Liparis tanakae TaxID=230148 RepID=A0A4Z2EVK9_9TELE|nr:hypothetical protein EYF80_056966 [Liparis tanakae]
MMSHQPVPAVKNIVIFFVSPCESQLVPLLPEFSFPSSFDPEPGELPQHSWDAPRLLQTVLLSPGSPRLLQTVLLSPRLLQTVLLSPGSPPSPPSRSGPLWEETYGVWSLPLVPQVVPEDETHLSDCTATGSPPDMERHGALRGALGRSTMSSRPLYGELSAALGRSTGSSRPLYGELSAALRGALGRSTMSSRPLYGELSLWRPCGVVVSVWWAVL